MNSESYLISTPLFDPIWKEWEGEFVLFDRNSGDIFYFDSITAFILTFLHEQEASFERLCSEVKMLFPESSDTELADVVRSRLVELRSRALIIKK